MQCSLISRPHSPHVQGGDRRWITLHHEPDEGRSEATIRHSLLNSIAKGFFINTLDQKIHGVEASRRVAWGSMI